MGFKITDYPAKTAFNDTDLYDCSTNATTSEKVTYSQLKTDLNSNLSFLSSVPSGVCGISNASGEYTYYSTLQDAIDAASAGDTVELFSDITETTDISVTLVAGVKINGNGHTYTLDFASATDALVASTASGNYYISNLNINRVNATSGSGLSINANGISVYGKNCYVTADGSGAAIDCAASTTYIENFTGRNTGTGEAIRAGTTSSKVYNCIGFSVSEVAIGDIFGYGIIVNCIAETDSGFAAIFCREAYNSYGKGNTGRGIGCEGNIDSCVGYSNTNEGIYGGQNCNIYNSKGESNSNAGIRGSRDIYGCTAISNSGYGMAIYIVTGKISNCTIVSTANYALYVSSNSTWTGGAYISNCHIESKLDTSSGTAIYFTSSNTATTIEPEVVNNYIKTKNAGAYGMFYSPGTVATRNINYANNSFAGMTVAIEAAISQGIVNTADSQGNILT